MQIRLAVLLLFAATRMAAQSDAQVSDSHDRTPGPSAPATLDTVVPGKEYSAGLVHRMVLGRQYRDLWNTPIEVRILDLEKFAGGLKPEKRSGSRQTVGLRFKGADGLEYNFRSVDKEPANALPPALKKSLVEKVFQDQMSAQYPAASVIVAGLLDAAGVLHPHPELYVMPDDPRLGEFQKEFAGLLGTIEEHRPRFPGARDIVETQELFDSLRVDPDQRVDAHAFLRARLLDILIGDWDRHADQWQWAAFPADPGDLVWRAVPEDRDWAFAKMDGPIAAVVRQFFPQTIGFSQDYPHIMDLTWTAKDLDRRLLSSLDRAAWDSIVTDVQRRLTDSVLAHAVRRQPEALYRKYGSELEAALRNRRDHLPEASSDFYTMLSREVDVHATDVPELVDIQHHADRSVTVSMRPRAPRMSRRTFQRRFVPDETREVRVYLHGGEDVAVARGERAGIKIRVIGAPVDRLLDSTRVGGVLFYPDRTERTVEKEQPKDTRKPGREEPDSTKDEASGPRDPDAMPSETFGPAERGDDFLVMPPIDWGHRWVNLPWGAFHRGQGVVLGIQTNRFGYGFRATPYRTRVKLKVGWAFAAMGPRLEGYWEDKEFVTPGLGARVEFHASKVEVARFYGFGNETPEIRPHNHARVLQDFVSVAPAVYNDDGRLEGRVGPFLEVSKPDLVPGTRLDSIAPLGAATVVLGGLQATARLNAGQPIGKGTGGRIGIDSRLARGLGNSEARFFRTSAEAAGYFSLPGIPLEPMFAARAGMQKIWGTYPFQDAAYVGGQRTVRGYDKQRFQGDAAIWLGTEARTSLFKLKGSMIGTVLFADAGRVFLRGESSSTWHRGFGGGLWGGIPGLFVANFVAGRSPEDIVFYVYTGVGF